MINKESIYRATLVLGFLPQELLGTSMYEYYHHDDIPHLAESHKAALQASESVTTQVSYHVTHRRSFAMIMIIILNFNFHSIDSVNVVSIVHAFSIYQLFILAFPENVSNFEWESIFNKCYNL